MNERALSTMDARGVADRFSTFDRLTVRQRKKWLEVLLSFEMRNQYEVFDESQRPVLRVQETSSGVAAFFGRVFLGPLRAFQVEVSDAQTGEVLLQLRRPFRFIFHQVEVMSGTGEPLGTVERRWSWFQRLYDVRGAEGNLVLDIVGPFFRPWTFRLERDGQTVGQIQKRWSGLGKELFTDADNFGVELASVEASYRALAFAAVVLIDVVHFERSKN